MARSFHADHRSPFTRQLPKLWRKTAPENKVGPHEMLLRSLAVISAVAAPCLAEAAGLDISFYGEPPVLPPGRRLNVVAGVNPGLPVVFDLSQSDRVVLRPVAEGETLTATQPHFRFEWREDKSARFYRLIPPTVLAELSAANARDTETAEGKDYELKATQRYFRQGEILRTCLPPNKPFRGTLTFFFVIGAAGTLDTAHVQPEGSIAECVLEQAKGAAFDVPPKAGPFTAKADIRVTE